MNYHPLRFVEVQYSRQWWLWLILFATVALTVGLFGYFIVEQLVFGRPVGNRPMSDTALLVTATLVFFLDVGLIALFLNANLRTEVREDGPYIRYFPFHWSFHRLPLEDLREVEAITYSPLRDYGGWGIRYGRKGKAYNPTGNRGVRLTYHSGRQLLIGSQKPDELADAIRSVWPSAGRTWARSPRFGR